MEEAKAKDDIINILHSDPMDHDIECSRWTLETISKACEWLSDISESGIYRILDRLGISWKQGRQYMRSPDPDYKDKLEYINGIYRDARESNGSIALLYQDETSYYRQPLAAQAWEKKGDRQQLARRSTRSDTKTRLAGAMDAVDGRVIYSQGSMITAQELVKFYIRIAEVYKDAERIYIVQDNWPVHFHPTVLVALEPQEFKWPLYLPRDWPDQPSKAAINKYGALSLPIQLVTLPTYAPWTNPIEKLWRKLKQELLRMHRFADRLDELREKVVAFLDSFINGSIELLRYVGLLIPD